MNFFLASISFASLSMYFVYWLNFAVVKTIVFAFIRNSREYNICRVFLVNTCLYFDSRGNLCFTLIITASVRWEIQQKLTIFCVSFPVKDTCEGILLKLKLQALLYHLQFYRKWTSFAGFFFLTFDRKCRPVNFRWLILFIAFT